MDLDVRVMWIALLALIGCGTAEPPLEAAPAPVAEPAPEAPAEPEKKKRPPKEIPTPPDASLKTMTLSGHGIELEMRPPFQFMYARLAETNDHLIGTWWDVTVEGSGGHVVRGIYSVTIVPGEVAGPDDEIVEIPSEHPRSSAVFRVGEKGTEIRLEAPLANFAQIGAVLKRGPDTQGWNVVDAGEAEYPKQHMIQSADPASGHTYEFVKKPSRPWGPWPPDAPPG